MSKLQFAVIGGAVLLFLGLFFGGRTKSKGWGQIEKSRDLTAESRTSGDISKYIADARLQLSPEQSGELGALEAVADSVTTDTAKIEALKAISGKWYAFGIPAVSGYYAEQIAALQKTGEAWGIAGTTYTIALQRLKNQEWKTGIRNKAIFAFDKAIELEPDKVEHQINKALCYVEAPLQNNPMQGVLSLIELDKKYPNNPKVLFNLGRLSMQTGQYDKAIERLNAVLAIDNKDPDAHFLIAQAYLETGNREKTIEHFEACLNNSKNEVVNTDIRKILNSLKN